MKKDLAIYRLILIGLIMLFSSGWAVGQGIFVSQNCDPSANYAPDRFAEIYNPTSSSVDLTGWTLENIQGGSVLFTWTLSGSIASGDALVCGNADATSQTITPDITATWAGNSWNGKGGDGTILKNALGTVIDNAVQLDATGTFENKEMVRKSSITSPTSTFNATEWTFTSITNAVDATPGTHTCILPSSGTTIALSTSTLSGFSYNEGYGPSAEQTFTVSGANLTHDISIVPATDYEISTTTGGSFSATNPITLTQSAGSVAEITIYTRLKAGLSAGDYSTDETITATSTDAADKTVSCGGNVLAASIIINEVDSDTDGADVLEFSELYDGGTGNTSLYGLVLVLYNGSDDLSYNSYDLDGETTDANGYFVIGNSAVSNVDLITTNGSLQNGADAVALYYGNAADFPNGTAVTTTDLIDAFVYDTDDTDDAGLLILLNALQPQINEDERGDKDNQSNQRIPNGSGGARNTDTYSQGAPTPGAKNYAGTSWTGNVDADWTNAGNWSNGLPTSNYNITIGAGATTSLSGTSTCNNIEIATSGALTISGTLTASGTVTIKSDASNNGSLIFTGSGNIATTAKSTADEAIITYERWVQGGKWHMLSAPVAGQDIATLLSNTADNIVMKDYNEGGDAWNSALSIGTMTSAKGYATKKDSDGIITISGTKNGTIAATLGLAGTGYGWNILGNPYTSEIRATSGGVDYLLNAANVLTLQDSYAAIYIWNEDGAYDGSQNYYKTVNNTANGTLGAVTHLQAGQGFFVKAKTNGASFGFNISMQEDASSTFYKDASADSWSTIELIAETNSTKSNTRIVYNNQMTRWLDISYDAGLLTSNPSFSLYTKLVEDNGVDFMIQALPTDYENLIVPIGLDAKAGEIITFSANALNIPEEYAVVLEDHSLNVFTDLSEAESDYSILLEEDSDGIGRFFVHTSFKSTTGIGDVDIENAFQAFTRVNDNQLIIRGEIAANTVARIFSITGKQIAVVSLQEATENRISFNDDAGIYILQITNKNETFTQKFAWIK